MSKQKLPQPSDRAKRIENRIFMELSRLAGFDWWWDDIDMKTAREIRRTLRGIIEKELQSFEASATPPAAPKNDGLSLDKLIEIEVNKYLGRDK
jgi:hypothetical protein